MTLASIEAAIEGLSPADKQELLIYIAARLRAESSRLPPPRRFTRQQMEEWIAEDERDAPPSGNGAA